MAEQRFKYRQEEFGELPVDLHHLSIYLNFVVNRVEALNCLEMTAKKDLQEIELDAAGLEIMNVEWVMPLEGQDGGRVSSGSRPFHGGEGFSSRGPQVRLDYEYLRDRNKLIVKLPARVASGERFWIRTLSHCFPSDHILEGIYKDSTPPGAPQQYMSQCQQWGFQRIMPILDDCRAKCTMTTTMEADAGYSHLISNGNVNRNLNPEGAPVPKLGDSTRQVITYDNPIPMAPYLFIAIAGTWDVLADEVMYESGRRVQLEYLVPPGAAQDARIPMEILKESIIWIRKTQDYEYTRDCYRTICMNKSNFGGMENVGNTTIVTDAALINEHTLDVSLLYAHQVIVHEFEHNQCGSETTMETPFDVWLNEAYTVDVERQFMADLFDPSFIRLNQVEGIRNPLLGPLAIEDGGHVGRIVRTGFNNPDELIDGVTYVKAAEVIRMLRLILGEEKFRAGKTLYFSRYHNGNANTDQFFECFEETSGIRLEQFKKEWLHRIGYPKVTAKTAYDAGTKEARLYFRQELEPGESPFHLPIELALVDDSGTDIEGTKQVFQLRETEAELVLTGIEKPPAFASMNRDYSFYGTFRDSSSTDENLIRQIRLDPNAYNRVDAMRQFTDRQRLRLLGDLEAGIDPKWLSTYGEILRDTSLASALKAYFLRIDEQPLDRSYSTWYLELVSAREKLMLAVNGLYRSELVDHFQLLNTCSTDGGRSPKEGIEDRMLKHVLFDLIVLDDTEESHDIIFDHFRKATVANDRFAALLALNRSSAAIRRAVLQEVHEAWSKHLSGYANYLRIVSAGTREDVFDMIEEEKKRTCFDVTQPTWCRALFLPMATNNKMVWTDRGIGWVADTVIELAVINTTTASRLLNTFQHVKKLKPYLQEKVVPALDRIARTVSEEASPTIHGQASAYLQGL